MRINVTALPIEWAEWCRKERPDLDPVDTFAQFRDYWLSASGPNALRVDWEATWRNWVRRAIVRVKPAPALSVRYGPVSTAEARGRPTAADLEMSRKVLKQAQGLRFDTGSDGWAKRLKARQDAGESLLPCQIEALRNVLRHESAEDREAEEERLGMMEF